MKRENIRRIIILVVIGLSLPLSASEIHKAARNADSAKLIHLLKHLPAGAANNTISRDITALHIAAAMNNADIMEILIANGANVNAVTTSGFTPLHWAAGKDAEEGVDLLIKIKANINAKAKQGITPLHWAASNNATNTIHILTNNGADMAARTSMGFCPLHWAIQKEAEDAYIILAFKMVSAGIDPEPPVGVNITPKEIGAAIVISDGDPALKTTANENSSIILQPFRKPVPGSPMKVPLGHEEDISFEWIKDLEMWVGKYEITNGQYNRFNPKHDSGFRYKFTLTGRNQPAVMVSWTEAKAFANWLNENFEKSLPQGYTFRLPTEDEWTTVAKCGDKRTYPWGDTWPPEYGNYSDKTAKKSFPEDWQGLKDYNDNYSVTCPVRLSGKNEWGIYGLAGNVWEWSEDWYDAAKRYKARRGASWDFERRASIRIDSRGFDKPDARCPTIGFRVVVGTTH